MHQIVTLDRAKCVVAAAEEEGFSEVVSERVLLVGPVTQSDGLADENVCAEIRRHLPAKFHDFTADWAVSQHHQEVSAVGT